jgi:hypothetical protein
MEAIMEINPASSASAVPPAGAGDRVRKGDRGTLDYLTDDDLAFIEATTGYIIRDGAVQNPTPGLSVSPMIMMLAAERDPVAGGSMVDGRPISSDFLSELFARQNDPTAGAVTLNREILDKGLAYILNRDRRDGDPGKGHQFDDRL